MPADSYRAVDRLREWAGERRLLCVTMHTTAERYAAAKAYLDAFADQRSLACFHAWRDAQMIDEAADRLERELNDDKTDPVAILEFMPR